MSNAEQPYPELSEHELREGREYYIQYLGAVASINAPGSSSARGLIGEGRHTSIQIVVHAEDLIWDSLCDVVRCAAGLGSHRGLASVERDYSQVEPNMRHIVDLTYELPETRARVDKMNKAFYDRRPAPFCKPPIYRLICRGDRSSLSTVRTLDGIQPARRLVPLLRRRLPREANWFYSPPRHG